MSQKCVKKDEKLENGKNRIYIYIALVKNHCSIVISFQKIRKEKSLVLDILDSSEEYIFKAHTMDTK